jgi:pimeloyl-ACP methyl ester carboxylesterase
MTTTIDAHDRTDVFVAHRFPEQLADLGEIRMNYIVHGDPTNPALLLIPAQTESWWGYEEVVELLAAEFQVHAVDPRGQGRSTSTPGRYSLDNWGNDLVRFIDAVIGRPTLVSGNSSGGVMAAWLAAYAKHGQIRGAVLEDPPLFASELIPSTGPGIRQGMGPMMALMSKWIGDQQSIGNLAGMGAAAMSGEVPASLGRALQAMAVTRDDPTPDPTQPPQNLREYDPEFGRAFYTGTATANTRHDSMLSAIRVPVLLSHHYHDIDPVTGGVFGALTDQQVRRAGQLITDAGQSFDVREIPGMAHHMHQQDPELFASIISEFASTLPRASG